MSRQPITLADINPKCLARITPTLRQPGNIEIDTTGRLIPKFQVPQEAVSGQNPTPTAEIVTKAKKPRQKTRTEAEYEAMLKRENPDCQVEWERYTLKLGNDCRYTPDFAVIRPDWTVEFHEVKGAYLFKGASKSATHTSLTKPKLAAELFPQHTFYRATKAKDGTWSREKYSPAEK